MLNIWRRPLWLLLGIPLVAVMMLLRRYGSDFINDRPLPIERHLAGLIIGFIVIVGFLLLARDRSPKSADEGSDYLARHYDWVPIAFPVVITIAFASTIGTAVIEDAQNLEASRFVQRHILEVSVGLFLVTGTYWLIDTFRRKTTNRAEFVVSRALMTVLTAIAVAGYFVFDRASLTVDAMHLTMQQYIWIATGSLIFSIVLLRR